MSTGFESMRGEFVLDARDRLSAIERAVLALAGAPSDTVPAPLLRDLRRELHTLKGNAGMVGLAELQQVAHAMEDAVARADGESLDVDRLLVFVDDLKRLVAAVDAPTSEGAADGAAAEAGAGTPVATAAPAAVRVPLHVLDGLGDLLAETVIQRNTLGALLNVPSEDRTVALEALVRTLSTIQDQVMALRMAPLEMLFVSLERVVHDEARRAGKQARLLASGGDTPLDRALLELASDALGHLVRNAVIHGLEAPAVRRRSGKPGVGTVRISALARGDEVIIEVADDGAGIDADGLREAAARKGFAIRPDDGPFAVLFAAGFSTRDTADLGAGRGVGLSAVADAVDRRGGRIDIRSEPGRGTSFVLSLPLTVSIVRALLLRADGEVYALPLPLVVESRRLDAGRTHDINHAGVLRWRGAMLPLLDLGVHFGTRAGGRRAGYIVVVGAGGRERGLIADALHGVQDVVVKGLDPICGRARGVSGSTVLPDGRPILILDPRALLDVRLAAEAR